MTGELSFGLGGGGRGRKRRRVGEGVGRNSTIAPSGNPVAEGASGPLTAKVPDPVLTASVFLQPGEREVVKGETHDLDANPEVAVVDVVAGTGTEAGISKAVPVDCVPAEEEDGTKNTRVVSQVAKLIERRRAKVDAGALDEDAAYRLDMEQCPEAANEEDYSRVPIENFGASLLKKMGWDGKPDGKSDILAAAPKSKLTGGIAPPSVPVGPDGKGPRENPKRGREREEIGRISTKGIAVETAELRSNGQDFHRQAEDPRREKGRPIRSYRDNGHRAERRLGDHLDEQGRRERSRRNTDRDREDSREPFAGEGVHEVRKNEREVRHRGDSEFGETRRPRGVDEARRPQSAGRDERDFPAHDSIQPHETREAYEGGDWRRSRKHAREYPRRDSLEFGSGNRYSRHEDERSEGTHRLPFRDEGNGNSMERGHKVNRDNGRRRHHEHRANRYDRRANGNYRSMQNKDERR